MFTGIVEEIGRIREIRRGEKSVRLTVDCREVLQDSKAGDSICVNGICLTVTGLADGCFTADVMAETLRGTNLQQLTHGSRVNLERAVSPAGRFGGHIVSGHVDGTGRILDIEKEDNAVWFTIEAAPELLKYIILKGSVAVDGISLTVQQLGQSSFKIALIPHTRDYTILPGRKVGDCVNLECDMIGKYVERLMSYKEDFGTGTGITERFLLENGF